MTPNDMLQILLPKLLVKIYFDLTIAKYYHDEKIEKLFIINTFMINSK